MAGFLKILQSFVRRDDAAIFREPVDWEGIGLVDYPEIIKRPMDLSTVKRKLVSRGYRTIHEAADDVRLIWSNCRLYNKDVQIYVDLADELSGQFEELFARLAAELAPPPPSSISGAAPPPPPKPALPLDKLPPGADRAVVCYGGPATLAALTSVSRFWRATIRQPRLWEMLCQDLWKGKPGLERRADPLYAIFFASWPDAGPLPGGRPVGEFVCTLPAPVRIRLPDYRCGGGDTTEHDLFRGTPEDDGCRYMLHKLDWRASYVFSVRDSKRRTWLEIGAGCRPVPNKRNGHPALFQKQPCGMLPCERHDDLLGTWVVDRQPATI